MKDKDAISVENAATELADMITGEARYTGSFCEFVRDIFRFSYEDFDFNWHLELLCEDEERAWKEGKRFLGVLPRMHSKSVTLGYAFTCWMMLRLGNCSVLYISYRDEQARWHCAEIKRAIRRNPVLREWLVDLIPEAEIAARFAVKGGGISQIYVGGVFSAKRGYHTNLVVVDDALSDPSNPLTYTQLRKVETHFHREIANIPLKGGMMVVIGTAMAPGDLLHGLRNNTEYISHWLPALNPDEEHDVLWESRFPKEWLDRKRAEIGEHGFRAEFQLYPAITSESYFTREELEPVISPDLKNYSIYSNPPVTETFGGFDVGKKRHPSVLSIVNRQNNILIQVHQKYLESMDYVDQVEYIKEAIKTFKIRLLYIDNTRGELEERGLPRSVCDMMVFGPRSGGVARTKGELAAGLERRVNQRSILIFNEERLISQLLAVDNSLRSPDTAYGHGDAFIALILAVGAYHRVYPGGDDAGGLIGDLAGVVNPVGPMYNQKETSICPYCKDASGLEYSTGSNRCNENEATKIWCIHCNCKQEFIEGEWKVVREGKTVEEERREFPNKISFGGRKW